jgi:thioredoxin reductase
MFNFADMEEETNYDVIIIGGGPIGLACGIRAKKSRTYLFNS